MKNNLSWNNLSFEERTKFIKNRYFERRKTLRDIASELGTSYSTVREFMEKYQIPRRNFSEAQPIRPRVPFSGDLSEAAYLLGLRTGDLHVRRRARHIEGSLATTHPAMLDLFKNIFSKYGKISTCPYKCYHGHEFGARVMLDNSFSFLIRKPTRIPEWIITNGKLFFHFLAGYTDAEGCWSIFRHSRHIGFVFTIVSSDRVILLEICEKLERHGFNPYIRIARKAGTSTGFGKCNQDLYASTLYKREDINRLSRILLPLSQHKEKIQKMQLMIKHEGAKFWKEVRNDVLALRQQISQEIINCKREAEIAWHKRENRQNSAKVSARTG